MITLVKTFTVLPQKQQDPVNSIFRVYTEVVQYHPGFISARLLVSNDGTKITAIPNWGRQEYLEAMKNSPECKNLHDQNFLKSIVSLSFESNLYQIVGIAVLILYEVQYFFYSLFLISYFLFPVACSLLPVAKNIKLVYITKSEKYYTKF
ncbi:MAG: antibiotic biosynthesis monooxygenase [Microcoleaceae cyanobacterium]